MNQLKGFSLIEVLVSLMLVTTLALALVQQQWQTHQFITQLVLHAGASHILDQVSESLLGNINKIPSVPTSYHLDVQKSKSNLILRIAWSNNSESITRYVRRMG